MKKYKVELKYIDQFFETKSTTMTNRGNGFTLEETSKLMDVVIHNVNYITFWKVEEL